MLNLPTWGFHRIRHYGLIANTGRRENLARARELLQIAPVADEQPHVEAPAESVQPTFVCPHCGAPMNIIDTLPRVQRIRAPPSLRDAT